MKKLMVLFFLLVGAWGKLAAQSQEAEQLLLNVAKLAQLKQILRDMKKGYTILRVGYTGIRNISQGNFDLHKTFLDGLLAINPRVRNYHKVKDIVQYQMLLLKEYQSTFEQVKEGNNFSPEEIEYLSQVYTNLFQQSLKNLDALTTTLTAQKLRMSDEERLKAIERLYLDMQDKVTFLRHFNHSILVLAIQRAREKEEIKTLQGIYGKN